MSVDLSFELTPGVSAAQGVVFSAAPLPDPVTPVRVGGHKRSLVERAADEATAAPLAAPLHHQPHAPLASPVEVFEVVCDEELEMPAEAFLPLRRRVAPFTLPHDSSKAMSKAFEVMCKGEMGVGAFCAEKFKNAIMSSSRITDAVWTYEPADGIWRRMPLEELRDRIHVVVSHELDRIGAYVIREVCAAEKEGKKAWMVASRRVDAAVQAYNTLRGLDNVVRVTQLRMQRDHLVDAFDSQTGVLPLAQGVLDLKTLELRPARDDDFLTYKLPYAWDPEASCEDICEFVHKLFEDDAAERAFQVMWGYLLTGETTEKRFWQWSCPSNGGKTTALMILCGAMGEFASRGVVPCDEIAAGARFQDLWADTLAALPKKRLITVDEIPPAFALHEALFNQATDGTSKQRLQLGRKGVKHAVATNNHAKYILSSNHVIHVSTGATGLVRRNSGVGLRFRFVEKAGYDKDSAPKADRAQDTDLVKRLLDPFAWPGILRWMAEGAQAWYAGESLSCKLFEESTFSLHVRGDPYLAWLADSYVPTGGAERISHADLVQAYRAAGRSASAGAAYAAITTLLATMTDFLVPASWNEHAVVVQGVEGLRARLSTDDSWLEHVQRAKSIRAEVREADARFNERYARATHASARSGIYKP